MSIFVDPNDTFPLSVRYVPLFAEVEGVRRQTGVRIVRDGSSPEGYRDLECEVAGRDHDTMSHVMEDSTVINHRSNDPMVRTRIFSQYVILRFFRSWNAADEATGDPIEINPDAVRYMHHSLVRALVRKWLDATG